MKQKIKIGNPFKKLPRIRKGIFALAAMACLLFLASFADNQRQDLLCKSVNVNILDKDQFQFVDNTSISKIVNKDRVDDLIGRKIKQIDLGDIEGRLLKNSFVKDAQAWFDMQGNLNVQLHQRVPIIRAIDPLNQEYYLDADGKRMPISSVFTPYVPIATTGKVNIAGFKDSLLRKYDSTLFVLALAIQKDHFMQALTGQIVVSQNNEISIIPRLGNFEISLGDINDLDDKFLRLRSFYQVTLPEAGWNTYKKISVKYKNQIIANR